MTTPTLARSIRSRPSSFRLIRSRSGAVLAAAFVLSLPVLSGLPAHAANTGTAAAPLGREWPSFSYYPPASDFVMFGGHNATTTFGDTWTRSGTTWTQQHPATSPAPRVGAPMVWDPATGQLLLFGGSSAPGSGFFGDTWAWNGSTWTQLHPATSPPARRNADMIYDATRQQVIMFGGWNGVELGDTWAWNGTTWTQLNPATAPAGRDSESLVYDPASQTSIMFGGFSGGRHGDTWSWDGTTWTQLFPASSPGMTITAWQAAYDTASNQLLLFGGDRGTHPSSNLTWVWSGTNWVQLSPAASPPGRAYGTMTYDPVTHRIELFGGVQHTTTNTYPNTVWNWNGTTWSKG